MDPKVDPVPGGEPGGIISKANSFKNYRAKDARKSRLSTSRRTDYHLVTLVMRDKDRSGASEF
jgi:hypothetical protein